VDVNQLMQQTRDALTVTRLFGEPHERNGVSVIPVAVMRGGGGGGQGEGSGPEGVGTGSGPEGVGTGSGPEGVGTGSGSGGGFGLAAKPAGAYVIEGNRVSWRPAVDVNRIVVGGQIVVIVALLVLRSVLRHR
jgi:uncharacterized spore protein YtfJ